MKKLNLDETWKKCLLMWRWIIRQPCPRNVLRLKEKWLKKNGFDYGDIESDCFFCDYANRYMGCFSCPGGKVEKNFSCCNYDYHYFYKPVAFLKKITELNKIRLAKKEKK